jgi:hypothetical protein
MDKAKKFMKLKEQWKKASETERAEIDKEISALLESMSGNETSELEQTVSDDFKRMHKDAADIDRTITVRKKLEPILPLINVAGFTRHYFGKSSSWFYQRMNGNIVHGKPMSFTDEELKQLQDAFQDLAQRMLSVQLA